MYYDNRYDNNYDNPYRSSDFGRNEFNDYDYEDSRYSDRYDNDTKKQKCCMKLTEFCCYPSYYTDDKYEDKCDKKDDRCHDDRHEEKCKCRKQKFDNDRCCHKEHHCNHECEDKKETRRPCKPCCPIFRNWCC